MKQTLKLGRIGGVPVGLHWSVLVIMLLLEETLALRVLPDSGVGLAWPAAVLLSAGGAVLFLFALLAHEMAHALVARRCGIRVKRVTLWLLGGVAEFADEPASARADLAVAAAGPLASVAAGVVFGAGALASRVLGAPAVVVVMLSWLAGVNVFLAAFNLLPGAPLDGGRVLRAVLWRWSGDRTRAAFVAGRVGRVLGFVLVALGLLEVVLTGSLSAVWLALIGWFLLSAAGAEMAATRVGAALHGVPVRAAMRSDPVCGVPEQSVTSFVPVAARSPHRAYPLHDAGGHPTGLVRLADLARVSRAARDSMPLARVAVPARRVAVVDASSPLAQVASLAPTSPLVLVVEHGVLVGVLNADDVAHAIDLAGLRTDRIAA